GRTMIQPDYRVHEANSLGRTERPALSEHQVVNVLQADAADLAEHIQRIEHLLQVDHAYLPGAPLLFDHRLQRGGGRTVASAGVEVDKINFRHECFIAPSHGCYARALKR